MAPLRMAIVAALLALPATARADGEDADFDGYRAREVPVLVTPMVSANGGGFTLSARF